MTTTTKSANTTPISAKDSLNYPDPSQVADLLRHIAFGDLLLGQTIQVKRSIDMVAQAAAPYNLSTVDALPMGSSVFPPAAYILRGTVRAGGVTGELVSDGYAAAAPATGHCSIGPNGNILTLGSDAITNVDFVYVPERGLVVEYTGQVSSGTLTLPTSIIGNGVVLLLEAEGLEGTITGKKVVLVPGTGPATLQARLAVAKTTVLFNSATDALTRARVKLLIALPSGQGLLDIAAAASTFV